jgi:hypothetical protein
MRKIVLLLAVTLFALTACNNSKESKTSASDSARIDSLAGIPPAVGAAPKPVDSATAPRIKFEKETYDFGSITSGEKVTYNFKFKNIGQSPLIISNAEASCGCTVPEFPDKPVNPGEEGIIKVVFDSSGKSGMQNKVVTITSNAIPATKELHIIGNLKEAKKN